MKFHNQKDLRFGHNLRASEQNWLAGQLISIRDMLTLDDKVTKDTGLKLAKSNNNPIVIKTTKALRLINSSSNPSLENSLTIPKDNKLWNAILVVILYLTGMSIFGTVAIGFWGFLPSFEPHEIMKYVFTFFTLLVGYGLFYYLYTFIYRAEHQISINAEEIILDIYPFDKHVKKVRPILALKDITTSREWKCVILKFNGYKELRVGFDLSNEEIIYVIGRLKSLVDLNKNRT